MQISKVADPGTGEAFDQDQQHLFGMHWFHTPLVKWKRRQCLHEGSYLHHVLQKHCPLTLLKNTDVIMCPEKQSAPRLKSTKSLLGRTPSTAKFLSDSS